MSYRDIHDMLVNEKSDSRVFIFCMNQEKLWKDLPLLIQGWLHVEVGSGKSWDGYCDFSYKLEKLDWQDLDRPVFIFLAQV